MIGGVILSEAILILVNKIMVIKETFDPVKHNPFEYFTHIREERDRSIVGAFCFVIFLKDGTDQSSFQ